MRCANPTGAPDRAGAPKAKRRRKAATVYYRRQPDRNKLILALWSLDRSSYSDIAEAAKCSRNAVAGVIDRARRAGLLPAMAEASQ